MTNQKINKPQQLQNKSIQDHLNARSRSSEDFSTIPNLYGMTLEEYIEGSAIHSKCFDQLKTIEAFSNL